MHLKCKITNVRLKIYHTELNRKPKIGTEPIYFLLNCNEKKLRFEALKIIIWTFYITIRVSNRNWTVIKNQNKKYSSNPWLQHKYTQSHNLCKYMYLNTFRIWKIEKQIYTIMAKVVTCSFRLVVNKMWRKSIWNLHHYKNGFLHNGIVPKSCLLSYYINLLL